MASDAEGRTVQYSDDRLNAINWGRLLGLLPNLIKIRCHRNYISFLLRINSSKTLDWMKSNVNDRSAIDIMQVCQKEEQKIKWKWDDCKRTAKIFTEISHASTYATQRLSVHRGRPTTCSSFIWITKRTRWRTLETKCGACKYAFYDAIASAAKSARFVFSVNITWQWMYGRDHQLHYESINLRKL